ncbi:MAG TPA: hypothetical protein VKQ32_17285 [Polyangia bacterium]|nr:hypothetical protein [Polyangia bacterium]
MSGRASLLATALAAAALVTPACGATVEVRPGAAVFAPTAVTIVELPPALEWSGPGAQAHVQRLADDSLLEVTGGRAVIAAELPGGGDADVQSALRALGEDAGTALTFSLSVGAGRRLAKGANPISTFQPTKRLVVDFVARVEVRPVGAPEVIGSVEAIESGMANEAEVAGNGEKRGFAAAIDEALEEAVRTFAPRIYTPRQRTLIVEVPTSVSGDLVKKVEILQQTYPELSMAEIQTLADSRERFLVVAPGQFAKLGVQPGDLLGVPGGETRASRAALARLIARGGKPMLAVVRGGQHYILSL